MATPAIGALRKYFVKAEATFNTIQDFVAADGMKLVEMKLEESRNDEESREWTGSGSAQAVRQGKRGGKWTIVAEASAAGLGVASDIAPLLKAAFGTETITGATSVVYALSNTVNTLQMATQVGDAAYKVANGCVCEKLEIKSTGGQRVQLMFSGSFCTFGWAYGCTVGVGGASSGASSFPYATATRGALGVGGVVLINGGGNTGAGYRITAVDDSATPPTVTITPALTADITAGQTVTPVTPTGTFAGSFLAVGPHAFTVDSATCGFVEQTTSLETGFHLLDKEATSLTANGATFGKRKISQETQAYFLDTENGWIVGAAWNTSGSTRSVSSRYGANTAAARMTLAMPKLYVTISPLEIAEAEESMVKINGMAALQSAAANDEMTLTFN